MTGHRSSDIHPYLQSGYGTPVVIDGISGDVLVSNDLEVQGDAITDGLTTTGGIVRNITTVNVATYDLLVTDDILHVTYTVTAAVTSLTLPTAQTIEGRTIVIKDAGINATTNNITIDTEGAQTIDGDGSLIMSTDAESVTLYCDGSNWFVI
jgi:hypothetical protein